MKKGGVSHSVQGSWLGRYFYKTRGDAYGFEAVFVDINGRVEGNILDDSTLGEALVVGSFGYPSIEFTKTYLRKSGTSPLKYRGSMSEDGKMLSGTWSSGLVSGTWLAVRTNDTDELKFEEWKDTFVTEEAQRPRTANNRNR